MRVIQGRVVNGKIEVLGEELVEGLVVTILAPEDRETFILGPEAEAALLASTKEADRSKLISEEDLEREEWSHLSLRGLEGAYEKDEPEYSLDMIKCPNPEYEGR